MLKLYDKMMLYAPPNYLQILNDAAVVDISNVYNYVYSKYERVDKRLVGDVTCIAPKYKIMFIEGTYPHLPNNPDWVMGGIRHGDLFVTEDKDAIISALSERPETHRALESFESARWIVSILQFIDVEPRQRDIMPIIIPAKAIIAIDNEGVWSREILFPLKELGEDDKLMVTRFHADLFIAYLALTFMHCANVEVLDNKPDKSESRRHQNKYGKPLTKWHTLKVHSMHKEYSNDGDGSQISGKRSLHIARGHFKDYRNGGGLFGKLNGIYWWDAHVRGDSKAGIVHKDYQVEPPTNE